MNKLDLADRMTVSDALQVLRKTQLIVSSMVPGAVTDDMPNPDQIRTYCLALVKETLELMDEFPQWKPWKEPKLPNKARVMDEFADILAFLGLLTVYVGALSITPADLAEAYVNKTNVNIARFNGEVDGYRVNNTTPGVERKTKETQPAPFSSE